MLEIILCVNRMTTFVSVSSYRMVAPSLEGNHDALADAKYQTPVLTTSPENNKNLRKLYVIYSMP